MATPKIKDVKGNEIRIQASQDKHFIDLYLGPWKSRQIKVKRSKPKMVTVTWPTAHRLYNRQEALKLAKRLTQVAANLK